MLFYIQYRYFMHNIVIFMSIPEIKEKKTAGFSCCPCQKPYYFFMLLYSIVIAASFAPVALRSGSRGTLSVSPILPPLT